MFINEIDFVHVKKEHEDGIIELILKSYTDLNKKYIIEHYRYLNYGNPIQDSKPLGLIAIYNNKIIGYIGFTGLPYLIGNRKLNILVPNGHATHPEYRSKGVARKIHEVMYECYSDKYTFFIGTSLNKLSIKGKIKQKWKFLDEKDYLYKIHLKKNKKVNQLYSISFENEVPSKIINRVFKDSIFSKEIKIDLNSIEFIDWIFGMKSYKWVLLRKDKTEIAYCCFQIKKGRCILIHFDMIYNDDSLIHLLDEIGNKFSINSFFIYSNNNKSLRYKILKKAGFWSTNYPIIRKILNKELVPILIRPTVKDYDLSYFIINKIDTSKIINWDITRLSDF